MKIGYDPHLKTTLTETLFIALFLYLLQSAIAQFHEVIWGGSGIKLEQLKVI